MLHCDFKKMALVNNHLFSLSYMILNSSVLNNLHMVVCISLTPLL